MINLTIGSIENKNIKDILKDLSLSDYIIEIYNKDSKNDDDTYYYAISFNVENYFSFNIYLQNYKISENKIKIEMFEITWLDKKAYSLKIINPKYDERFSDREWSNNFINGETSAIISLEQFYEILKFSARMSKMKIFT